MPEERVLGQCQQTGASGVMREKRECCYDVPLLKSLQALLKMNAIQDEVCYNMYTIAALINSFT